MALYLLQRHPAIELLGITTVHGNAHTEITTRNALFLSERFGIDAPGAQGARQPLVGKKDLQDWRCLAGQGLKLDA